MLVILCIHIVLCYCHSYLYDMVCVIYYIHTYAYIAIYTIYMLMLGGREDESQDPHHAG